MFASNLLTHGLLRLVNLKTGLVAACITAGALGLPSDAKALRYRHTSMFKHSGYIGYRHGGSERLGWFRNPEQAHRMNPHVKDWSFEPHMVPLKPWNTRRLKPWHPGSNRHQPLPEPLPEPVPDSSHRDPTAGLLH